MRQFLPQRAMREARRDRDVVNSKMRRNKTKGGYTTMIPCRCSYHHVIVIDQVMSHVHHIPKSRKLQEYRVLPGGIMIQRRGF